MTAKLTPWAAFVLLLFSIHAFTQNCPFSISSIHAGPTCPNAGNGWISLTVEGAGGDFSFLWQNLNGGPIDTFAQHQSDLSAGRYKVTVADGAGCSDTLSIVLMDDPDVVPPSINCPPDQVVGLGPDECERIVQFSVSASDNCSENLQFAKTDSTGLSSGDAFPIGTTILVYEATDGTNTTSCSFSIKINAYGPPSPSLSCNGLLNVSVNENCSANLSAQTLLSGQYGCYDAFEVTLMTKDSVPIKEADFSNFLNKTIYGKVSDPTTENECYSHIILRDFLKPIIHCQSSDTVEVSCGASMADVHPKVLGYPIVTDNCRLDTLFYFDQFNELSCNDPFMGGQYSAWIKRTWNAKDAAGNTATPCFQYIFFKRKTLAAVVFPKNLTENPNDNPYLECGSTDFSPEITGVPTVDGLPIFPNNLSQCEMLVSYTDNLVDACGSGFNIMRTWTVHNNCGTQLKTHIQLIRVMDREPPKISCQATIPASTNTNDCKAVLFVPYPTITDNCSSYSYQILHNTGLLVGNMLFNLPIGNHPITYVAADECGNQSTCQSTIVVKDGWAPIADCDPSKNVSLSNGGITSFPAIALNDKSYDDCGSSLQFHARRLDNTCNTDSSQWGSTVKFCCDDAGLAIKVELKVTDFSGNFSTCQSVIQVNDFIKPSITCPSSLTIDCDLDYSDLSVLGKIAFKANQQGSIIINGVNYGKDGIATDNCELTITELPPTNNINDCHVGTITRHFTATDAVGHSTSCNQVITVVNNRPFYINKNDLSDPTDDMEFPPSTSISDCSGDADPTITGRPIVLREGCGQIGTTYSDQIFPINGDGYVIKRKWSVRDFCQPSSQGSWQYLQNITVLNVDLIPPQIMGIKEVVFICVNETDCNYGFVNYALQASDDCTSPLNIKWQYKVDFQNDGSVDLTGYSNSLFGTLPLGIHRSDWTATDDAGNSTSGVQFFLVEDCTPPALTCPDTLHVTLNSAGVLFLSAKNMQGSLTTDNCSSFNDLTFEANFYDPSYQADTPPQAAKSQLYFTCPTNIHHVQLWAGDETENWSKCELRINVSDFYNKCEAPTPLISIDGNFRTETGKSIGQVGIQVNNGSPVQTDNNGYYAFYDLPSGGDFTIIPTKNIAPLNGVTTFDLVQIRRHILGVQPLDSPYKMIAADVNNSGSITTSDLVVLQKLILHVEEEFPNNTSWRFIDASFVFPDPLNPFATPLPLVKSLNNLLESKKVDFIGIKVGDVNGSANPMGLMELEGDEL